MTYQFFFGNLKEKPGQLELRVSNETEEYISGYTLVILKMYAVFLNYFYPLRGLTIGVGIYLIISIIQKCVDKPPILE